MEAVRDLNVAIEHSKGRDWEIYYERGLVYYHDAGLRDTAAALADFKIAAKKAISRPDCITYVGDCYSLLPSLQGEAVNYFRSLLSVVNQTRDKELAKTTIAMVHLQRGRMHVLGKSMRSAKIDFNSAIELDPACAVAYLYRGSFLSLEGQFLDRESSLLDFNKALALDPRLYDALLQRGNLHMDKGEITAAIKDYRQALKINPHVIPIRLQIAVLYMRNFKDFRKGLLECKRILAVAPDTSKALHLRARAQARQGRVTSDIIFIH